MKNYRLDIKKELDIKTEYRKKLFCRGYLFTDNQSINDNEFPFYGLWNKTVINQYYLFTHPDVNVFVESLNNNSISLVGHAYNPFDGVIDERKIIKKLLYLYKKDYTDFLDYLDELTGVFVIFIIVDKELYAVQDCGGQKMLYFGAANGYTVLSSSPQMVSDLFDLQPDDDISKLLNSNGYYRGSGFLPGNMSPFKELKRLGPNTCLRQSKGSFIIERIFPRTERNELKTNEEKKEVIDIMHDILSNNIALTIKKWNRTALSLTGGMDSQTSFANASDFWNSLFVYSFISKESEKLDAEAAEEICSKLAVTHHLYKIPENNQEIEDYEILDKILEHNTSYTCKLHDNEKRKYIYLEKLDDFDIEIKSDMSEVGRAYTERKYYKVSIPQKMSPRHLTITQGRYFLEPWCFKYADKCYADFIDETGLKSDICGYSMHDLAYWEVRMGSWAATSFASQEYIHEITIPYNNRKLLNMFLLFPEEDRKKDIPHLMLMKKGNMKLYDMNVHVKDSYMGKKRMIIETVYYYYATIIGV